VRRLGLLLVVGLSLAIRPLWAEEAASPHQMVGPDGQVEAEKCAICHNEDMSLARSKVETCTLCHAVTVHSGANEHLRAAAASVSRLLSPTKAAQVGLPLTEDGRIYCGTCHVFHDPAISNEETLASPWVPPSSGLPGSVRQSVEARWKRTETKQGESEAGATFSTKGTRRLRFPIEDGSLCRQCHSDRR
jgi:hypothetical protein